MGREFQHRILPSTNTVSAGLTLRFGSAHLGVPAGGDLFRLGLELFARPHNEMVIRISSKRKESAYLFVNSFLTDKRCFVFYEDATVAGGLRI